MQTRRPRLTAPRRGPINDRLTVGRGARRFSGSGARYGRNFYGGLHWYHHRHSLGFNFGFGLGFGRCWGFGLYSFPYYYGCYYPRFYYNNCFNYIGCWNGYSPYWGRSCWWWPQSYCYAPIINYYDGGGGGGGFVDYGGYGVGSSVTIASGKRVASTERPVETKEAAAERHVGLGDFYFKEGRYKEAAESYTRALTYAPDDASLHFLLADALFATGDYHYAAYVIGEALRLDPEMAKSEADKREFYGKRKDFDEQLKTLREYIVSKPYDAAAQLVLGYNLKFSAQRDAAIEAFRRVLKIEPGNEPAKLFLAALTTPAPAEDSSKESAKPADESATSKPSGDAKKK